MTRDPLWRSWSLLLLFSLASTAAALSIEAGLNAPLAGVMILVLAHLKLRIILADYLGLSTAPFWLRGFKLVIGLYMLLLLGLYLIPEI